MGIKRDFQSRAKGQTRPPLSVQISGPHPPAGEQVAGLLLRDRIYNLRLQSATCVFNWVRQF